MAIRELRITPDAFLEVISRGGRVVVTANPLPKDARVTDVALDHGHGDTNRGTPPVIVLQISSNDFTPEDAGRALLPMAFRR